MQIETKIVHMSMTVTKNNMQESVTVYTATTTDTFGFCSIFSSHSMVGLDTEPMG